MTIHPESSIERREAVTVVQAEMMVARPTMVEWKWWDRKFQNKLGSGGQGERIKAVSLFSGIGNLLVVWSWERDLPSLSLRIGWGMAGDPGLRLKT